LLLMVMTIENEEHRSKIENIYRLYRGTMLYIANSILHDNLMAEDAVSEAMLRIIDHIDKINEIDCYQTRGFVVIIVRNISYDMIRKKKRNKEESIEDYLDYSEQKEPVFTDMAAKDACEKITASIEKLNKPYADILYLKATMNYTNEQIASILGISAENVKVRLNRARKALKEQLRKDGECYEQ